VATTKLAGVTVRESANAVA